MTQHTIVRLLPALMLLSIFAFAPGASAEEPIESANPSLPPSAASQTGMADAQIRAAVSPEEPEADEWGDEDFEFEDEAAATVSVRDPLSPLNRVMFQVTDRLFDWVLKPLVQAYNAILPSPARTGIGNFFHNIASPVRFVSCALQGKGKAAGGEFSRFLANSTVGLVGFLDVAETYPELNPPEEDLGQVFGKWGIGHGFYIYWPLLGPSSLRDTVGLVGDRLLNPATYAEPSWVPPSTGALSGLNAISFRIDDYEALRDAAIEPYEAFRDAYIQYREKAVSE